MSRPHRCTPWVCLLGAALAAGAATASLPAQTRILFPPRPVTVEFRALGVDGVPVLDLAAADVTVKVGGKVRELQSLDLVRFDDGAPDGAATGLPEPFATNAAPVERRDILFVLEDDSIAPGTEKAVRAAADRLLEALSPRDRVGLLNIPRGGINIGLTTDREQIRDGVAQLVGLSTRGQTVGDARCRAIMTLQALKDLFLAVRGGKASTIVFFSSGVAPADTSNVVLGQSSELCVVKLDYFNEVRDAAALARVNFYAVHVYNDTAIALPSSTNDLVAGLESLAGTVNGDTIRLTTQDAQSIARLPRETSAIYRATFNPEPGDRDDRLHRVDVSTSRRGVAIRADYAIAIARALSASATRKPTGVTDLLRTDETRRDLPLRAAAYASKGVTNETVKVVTVIESSDARTPLTAAAVGVYDGRGRLTSQVTLRKEELALTPAFTAVPVKPGTYRLRVAAADAAGRLGTVDTEIEARLVEAGPVTLSAMVLGITGDGDFSPRLQFGQEPALVAYLEIYGVPKATEVTVMFELAETRDGPAMGTVPGRLQLGSEDGSWQASAGLGLAPIPPGEYLLRAIVFIDGTRAGHVIRTLRKVA